MGKREGPIFLVVGADGLIGNALMNCFRRTGARVIGTTMRSQLVNETCIYLDLAKDLESFKCPHAVQVAFICAGVTKIDACKQDPERTAHINVCAISKLSEMLVSRGAFVVYLSTNQVFDGKKPYRLPDDPHSPIIEYGRQKSEAEQRIKKLGDAVAIVRFTKILSSASSLFSIWIDELKKGKIIQPYMDMYLSPIPVACAVTVLQMIAYQRLAGITQVSGTRDVSYADAAKFGAKLLGVDLSLVQPHSALESGQHIEALPMHTTLDITRLRILLGVEPPDVLWTIEKAFTNPIPSFALPAIGGAGRR